MTNETTPPADLEATVALLVEQGVRVQRAITRQTRTIWVAIAVGILLVVALAGTALDTRRTVRQVEGRLCPLVSILIPGPTEVKPPPGPAGDRGRSVIGKAERWSERAHCDDQ